MNKLSDDSKKSMIARILTAFVLSAIGLPLLVLGNWYTFGIILVLALISIYEMVKAPGKKRYPLFLIGIIYIFVLSFIYWQFLKDESIRNQIFNNQYFTLTTLNLSTIGILTLFLILFFISIINKRVTLSDVCYLFTMSVFIGFGVYASYFLRYFPANMQYLGNDYASCILFFYVMIGTYMSDIGAYFIGVLFGKHRMNPRISPKKSWEGFFGGWIISIAFSISFAAIMEYCFDLPLIPNVICFSGTNWKWIVLLSVIMPLAANLGDFLFSSIKRNFVIKDFGTIFPGHGGVLDRCDSLITTNIIIAILVLLISNDWNFLM